MRKRILTMLGLAFILSIGFVSCDKSETKKDNQDIKNKNVVLKDYGNSPFVVNIEEYTIANENYRTVLWTSNNLQLALMSIPVGGDIGLELHSGIDQFIRIEEGKGRVMMGDSDTNLDFIKEVEDDFAILVPSGKWHNIVNTGDKPLKIYSIYSPAEHPHGTIYKTQADISHNH